MNRRDKLLELRQIISTMQQQITTLEQANLKTTPKDRNVHSKHLDSHSKSPSSNRNSDYSPLKLQEYSPSRLNRWKLRQQATKKSIEKYLTIAQSIDTHYYSRCQRKPNHPARQPLSTIATKVDQNFYLLADKEQEGKENQQKTKERPQQRNEEGTEESDKRKRIKIFDSKHPIQSRQTDHKQAQQRQRFPTSSGYSAFFYPHSNPNLKFFGYKGVVSKGKKYLSTRRNRSLIFGGSSLVEMSNSCSKRHYNRYFADHYNSCIS